MQINIYRFDWLLAYTTKTIDCGLLVLSVLLVGETGVPREYHRSAAIHWPTLSHNVVSSTPRLSGVGTHKVVVGADCIGYIVAVSFLVGETGVPREYHRSGASHWQTLSHNVVSSTPRLCWIQALCNWEEFTNKWMLKLHLWYLCIYGDRHEEKNALGSYL